MLRQLISRVAGGGRRRPAGGVGGVGRRRGAAGPAGGSANGDIARGVEQAARGFLRKRRWPGSLVEPGERQRARVETQHVDRPPV